jgi:creatinine amidohydrolase/Fe(II)-dependent formamide hydrolase-like protein
MSGQRLDEMFPAEAEARIAAGNAIAIVPIGSLEQHGPHLPLWTDGFEAEALAQEVGRLSGGTVFPTVPFSWVGCTNVFSGGIGTRESLFIAYLRAVVKGIWRSGFRCILLINMHGGNYYALQSFPHDLFKEEGIPVLCTFGMAKCKEANNLLEQSGGEENSSLAGALHLLGHDALLAEVQENLRRAVAEFGDRPAVHLEPQSARAARRLGVVGHDYSHECLHVQPDSRCDPDAGAEAIRKAAEHIAGVLGDLRTYVENLFPKDATSQ